MASVATATTVCSTFVATMENLVIDRHGRCSARHDDDYGGRKRSDGMAIAFARAETLNATSKSLVNRGAYALRLRHVSRRTGKLYNYSNRHDLVATGLALPIDSSPWAGKPMEFLEAVEARATRKNALLGLELVLALPDFSKMDPSECFEVVQSFARRHLVEPHDLGVVIAIHAPAVEPPPDETDLDPALATNTHSHLIVPLFQVGPTEFGARVDDLLPIRKGQATIDAPPWTRLWREHLDHHAALGGHSWRVRLPAPHAGRHVGPASARMVMSLEMRSGRHGRVNSRSEAANRIVCRDPKLLVDALPDHPFTSSDVERLVSRYAAVDRATARALVEEVLSSEGCVRLADPDAGPTKWHVRSTVVLTEIAAIEAAERLVFDPRSRDRADAVESRQRLRVLRVSKRVDHDRLLDTILQEGDERRRHVVALGHNEGSLTRWCRDQFHFLDLRRAPNVVAERGAVLVLDGAERARPSVVLDALLQAEATRSDLVLISRTGTYAPLLTRISDICGVTVVGEEDHPADWRDAVRSGDVSSAARSLVTSGAVLFAENLADARLLAEDLVLGAGGPSILLDGAVLAEREISESGHGKAEFRVPTRGALVAIHDPVGTIPIIPLATGVDTFRMVVDRSRTPHEPAFIRQAAATLRPVNACHLAIEKALAAVDLEEAASFRLWCEIERALLRRRAARAVDHWPGPKPRHIGWSSSESSPLTPEETATIAREERYFGALWQDPEVHGSRTGLRSGGALDQTVCLSQRVEAQPIAKSVEASAKDDVNKNDEAARGLPDLAFDIHDEDDLEPPVGIEVGRDHADEWDAADWTELQRDEDHHALEYDEGARDEDAQDEDAQDMDTGDEPDPNDDAGDELDDDPMW